MNRINCTAMLLIASITVLGGCRTNQDIAARYRLEKNLWKAQALEGRLDITATMGSALDIETVMNAYRDVASFDEIPDFQKSNRNSSVVRDLRMLVVRADIAEIDLAFRTDRLVQPGIFFRSLTDDPVMYLDDSLRSKRRLARILYGGRSCGRLDMESEPILGALAGSDDFWNGTVLLRDNLLDIPLVLLQACGTRSAGADYAQYDDMAEAFYTKVIRVWPDSLVAEKARLHMIALDMIREDWTTAVRAIDDMLGHRFGETIAPRLMILKAYVLAEGKNDPVQAADILAEVSRSHAGSEYAFAADLGRGFMFLRGIDEAQGVRMLEDLEKDERASDEVRSAAMLLRAEQLERTDEWNESMLILNRIMRFYSSTPAALEGPLIATRHYLAVRDTAYAEKNLIRAKTFYESLIKTQNMLFERGYVIEDYLIENYVLANRTADVARILSDESVSWGWSRHAAALLKSAHLYANELHDRHHAAELLRQCAQQFPGTRYERTARRELEWIESD